MKRSLLVLVLLASLVPASRAFDVAECDGDGTLGNAGILLGWATPTVTSMGAIVIDDQGAANSGISPADADADWAAAIGYWSGVSGTSLVFPATSSSTITSTVLQNTLGAGDGSRGWMIVQPGTQISGKPGGQGWEHITGTDRCSFLGLTYTVFDLNSRQLLDADILLNDDGPAPLADPDCTSGRADFYSQAATGGVPQASLFDLRGIMAHEIGHFLGSDHSIQGGALMEASASPGTNLAMTTDDENLARFVYPTGTPPAQPDRNDTSLVTCSSQTVGGTGVPPSTGGGGGGCNAGGARGGFGLSALLVGALLALPFRRRRPGRS